MTAPNLPQFVTEAIDDLDISSRDYARAEHGFVKIKRDNLKEARAALEAAIERYAQERSQQVLNDAGYGRMLHAESRLAVLDSQLAAATGMATEIAPCNPNDDSRTILRRAVVVHSATVAACEELRSQLAEANSARISALHAVEAAIASRDAAVAHLAEAKAEIEQLRQRLYVKTGYIAGPLPTLPEEPTK